MRWLRLFPLFTVVALLCGALNAHASGYGTGGPGNPTGAVAGKMSGDCSMTSAGVVTCTKSNTFPVETLLGQSNAASSATADTSEDTLATVSIPANSLGANGCLSIDSLWTYTNSSNNKTLRIRLGGGSGTAYLNTVLTTTAEFSQRTKVCNANATGSQIGVSFGGGASTGSPGTSSVDTTASTTLVFTGQKASAGETLTLAHFAVELDPHS